MLRINIVGCEQIFALEREYENAYRKTEINIEYILAIKLKLRHLRNKMKQK